MRTGLGGTLAIVVLCVGLSACGQRDTTKQACQSLKDVSFNSVVGPLYDGASDSFKRTYDKVDSESVGDLNYYSAIQELSSLCAKYGVKRAESLMG